MSVRVDRNTFRDDRLRLFWWFVCERQGIWYRRTVLKQNPPWTTDAVLQTARFTNIYRELDPGTRYAIENILELDESPRDQIFNVMLYRLIGRTDTHAAIGFQRLDGFDPDRLRARLKYRRDVEGRPVFTAAYMVSAYSQLGTRDKIDNVVRLFTALHADRDRFFTAIDRSTSAAQLYRVLRTPYGFGNFLAYQVLVDLLYPLCRLGGRPLLPYSHDDWASAGPGARRGIAMLLPDGVRVPALSVMRWLRANQEEEFGRLGFAFPYLRDAEGAAVALTLANIQNSLCEFHKYVKIKEGTGRGRRTFQAGARGPNASTAPARARSSGYNEPPPVAQMALPLGGG